MPPRPPRVPDLGVGIGLRVPHYRAILDERPPVDFFEIISENFMVRGGKPRHHLELFAERYRLVPHGVSLGIGGPEPPCREYLTELKKLVRRLAPPWVSDHFCWSGVPGMHLHELLPLPQTREVAALVAERARVVQDFLEVPLALENTSSYLEFSSNTLTEWQFVSEVADQADIGLLFDVNNVYVSATNHGFDPLTFISSIPVERIFQIHVAGHTNLGPVIIDTHRGAVVPEVWDLYAETIRRAGPISTLVEWDEEIPELPVVLSEAATARRIRDDAMSRIPAPLPLRSTSPP
ncbi:MAG TPA: DUF692 domain-containing protein [Polyangiaceae bacterium]|nr:DUF692 domain-containing protein [Polyangiaceae bacterium]